MRWKQPPGVKPAQPWSQIFFYNNVWCDKCNTNLIIQKSHIKRNGLVDNWW